ncbi:hypothetical protein [Parasphingorhabdus sp.]|uniref:hypothetical protein n=1 Tax=Parasphingorhabdus sp. TaxID=2709688 RepID=UPI003263A82C
MRNSLAAFFSAFLLILAGCSDAAEPDTPPEAHIPGVNTVAVIGAIHGQHRRSETYSLAVLEAVIVKFDPDVVMVELPPDRYAVAAENYAQFGEVRESRADDFPELIDVVFPLQNQMGFTVVPVAAWSRELADERRAALKQIEGDPARTDDWSAYQSAIQKYGRAVSGKSDNPDFIHSHKYDLAVRTRQESYERLFGSDLGAGGWEAINRAHFAKMASALDDLDGQEKRILILFGAWHKYWILDALDARSDIRIADSGTLFSN